MQKLDIPESRRILEKLRVIYLSAERELMAAIAYKRRNGYIDYAEIAALERVQRTLQGMVDKAWQYVPQLIESQFYVNHPEAARLAEPVAKHIVGYGNAQILTAEQTAVVEHLTNNLMGSIIEASTMAQESVLGLIGRLENDPFRKVGLSAVAQAKAEGVGFGVAGARMQRTLEQEGITAFVDKAGRKWTLYNYANMVTRTTRRQAAVLAILTRDPDHDLYQISSHGTTCPVCAPLEGRVYSRSGTDPDFPPLGAAFGKIDPAGPNTLQNSYLNIHPNCLHVLVLWSPAGLDEREVERIKRFSSFKTNPPDIDPRSTRQIEEYHTKERGRAKLLADMAQYRRYRGALGDGVPKTFQTFYKHKTANSDKYKGWLVAYRSRE